MIQVYDLSKEDRIQNIFTNLLMKESKIPSFSPYYTTIDPIELMNIIKLIENKVYYISDSPAFEFQNRMYASQTIKINFIEEFKIFMDNHPDEFFILYSIQANQTAISNAPGISKSYNIRGYFVDDPAVRREKVINKILDE